MRMLEMTSLIAILSYDTHMSALFCCEKVVAGNFGMEGDLFMCGKLPCPSVHETGLNFE